MRAFVAFLWFVLSLAITERALAFTAPTMTGHVTDTAGKLSEADRVRIDQKLEAYRLRTTNEIGVFIPASLDGETIEEVGVATGRAWQLGVKGKDNGVLLVIAPVERRARIEVGKGIEGALTDLQTNDIIRQKLRPRLLPGHEDYTAAVDDGVDAIVSALDAGGATGGRLVPKAHATSGGAALGIFFLLLVFLVPIILFIVIIRAITSAFSSHGPTAGRGWASGGTWSSDSSWSSSSNDSSWGGGGGGDSGFTGGGGDFGGGGSSDSF